MTAAAIILAAGKGTRMKSDRPKVMHEVCGRPMLAWVLEACASAGCRPLLTVIGHQPDRVREAFAGADHDVRWVLQEPQLGTGHAVTCCLRQVPDLHGPVVVVAGDGPLIRPQTLRRLVEAHLRQQAACTLATAVLDDPGRYGRIVRDDRGEVAGIVEYLDADQAQRQIREVNVTLYCFDADALRDVLGRVQNDNAKHEYYLTDAVRLLREAGSKLAAVEAVPPEEVLSINTPDELAEVDRILTRRLAAEGPANDR
jgi:bifunctional UDP-N-acetylglucosamine pyrophosphorylase/glucosamine-1-phosphate N-acetyltransferase